MDRYGFHILPPYLTQVVACARIELTAFLQSMRAVVDGCLIFGPAATTRFVFSRREVDAQENSRTSSAAIAEADEARLLLQNHVHFGVRTGRCSQGSVARRLMVASSVTMGS